MSGLVEITQEENAIAKIVFESAQEVHKALGPGLLESAYRDCLEYELKLRGLDVEHEVTLPLTYKTLSIGNAFRLDLWVNRRVIIELKSVANVEPVCFSQLNTYLKLTNCNLGLLVNFNVRYIGEGFHRWVVAK